MLETMQVYSERTRSRVLNAEHISQSNLPTGGGLETHVGGPGASCADVTRHIVHCSRPGNMQQYTEVLMAGV